MRKTKRARRSTAKVVNDKKQFSEKLNQAKAKAYQKGQKDAQKQIRKLIKDLQKQLISLFSSKKEMGEVVTKKRRGRPKAK